MENLELNFKIGPIPRGPYSATTLYAMNDNVQTETGIYGSRKDGNVGHPVTDTEWWSLLVDLSAIKNATDACQDVTEEAETAELARVAAENARALAETARATAETSRVSAEALRASAEESRETAEEERASAETSRESAEDVRAAAETSRVQSETGRAQAENARAAEFAELKAASQEASADALEAAGTANTAAAAADAAREGIQEDLDGKVDKVAGKGLSSEDYTAAEKGKVANVPADTNAAIADLEERKADKDGFYESLGAGYAKSLLGNGAATPELIDFRPSGGTKDIATGVQALTTLFGNTVVMNQLVKNGKIEGLTNIEAYRGTVSEDDGSAHFVVSEESTQQGLFFKAKEIVAGHKYFISADIKTNVTVYLGLNFDSTGSLWSAISSNDAFTHYATVFTSNRTTENVSVRSISASIGKEYSVKNLVVFDLTAMLEAGNEPTTLSDPHIKWLQSLGYVGHNAGSLLNYKGTGLKTTGVNQFDSSKKIEGKKLNEYGEEIVSAPWWCSNYIRVEPNTTYYFKNVAPSYSDFAVFWFDCDKNFVFNNGVSGSAGTPASGSLTSPSNAYYVRIHSTYASGFDETQIALYHSGGDIPTTYHPYEEHILNLPVTTLKGKKDGAGESVVIFPDGMKSAGTAKDYLYGNVLGSFTKAKKVIGKINLGELNWRKSSTNFNVITDVFPISFNWHARAYNMICVKYISRSYDDFVNLTDGVMTCYSGTGGMHLAIKDAGLISGTAEEFKAAMANVELYYELATPEDYVLDEPIVASGMVNDWGTDMNLPQGKGEDGQPLTTLLVADVVYGPNVQDAVKNLPKNYIGKDSMEAILTAFVTAGIIGAYTLTYDDETAKYQCSITPVTPAE